MLQSPVVSAQGLTKQFPDGTIALRDVSLSLGPGKLVAVLGPSGSGKTTLFRLCNGSVLPSQGTLRVLGADMKETRSSGLRRLRRRLAVVYQDHSLVSSLSVLHNVLIGRLGRINLALAIKTAFFASDDDRYRVGVLLEALGIADKIDTRVDDLSGGQQQRVAVARALIQEPELLLADEPVASVDEETAIVILDLLAATCRERGTAVLVSLHQRQYVQRYADRILELSHGLLIKDIVTDHGMQAPPEPERTLVTAW